MSRDVIDILRETLAQIERTEGYRPDDPAMVKVRREILRTIIKLKTAKEPTILKKEEGEAS